MNSLFVIPARGGSKGICKKNIRELCGKPLICYTLETVSKLAPKEDICVTSDDEEIIRVVEDFGFRVPFRRPAELSTDTASQYEVVRHAYMHYLHEGRKYDNIVLLQPTSPLRDQAAVKEQIAEYSSSLDMVVSVMETAANPYFVLFEEDSEGNLVKSKAGSFTRRQDCPKVWQFNGSCYVINPDSLLKYNSFAEFRKIKKYVMPALNSVDIDNEIDWDFCEFLINRSNKEANRKEQ